FQAEDGIRDDLVTGVQTCALPILVQRYQANRKLTFKGGPPSPNPSTRALEHKVQMAKKQSTMSAPSLAKRITTTGLAKVALPERSEERRVGKECRSRWYERRERNR